MAVYIEKTYKDKELVTVGLENLLTNTQASLEGYYPESYVTLVSVVKNYDGTILSVWKVLSPQTGGKK